MKEMRRSLATLLSLAMLVTNLYIPQVAYAAEESEDAAYVGGSEELEIAADEENAQGQESPGSVEESSGDTDSARVPDSTGTDTDSASDTPGNAYSGEGYDLMPSAGEASAYDGDSSEYEEVMDEEREVVTDYEPDVAKESEEADTIIEEDDLADVMEGELTRKSEVTYDIISVNNASGATPGPAVWDASQEIYTSSDYAEGRYLSYYDRDKNENVMVKKGDTDPGHGYIYLDPQSALYMYDPVSEYSVGGDYPERYLEFYSSDDVLKFKTAGGSKVRIWASSTSSKAEIAVSPEGINTVIDSVDVDELGKEYVLTVPSTYEDSVISLYMSDGYGIRIRKVSVEGVQPPKITKNIIYKGGASVDDFVTDDISISVNGLPIEDVVVPGKKVEVSLADNSNIELSVQIRYEDKNGKRIVESLTETDGVYSFVMPESNVTLYVTAEKTEKYDVSGNSAFTMLISGRPIASYKAGAGDIVFINPESDGSFIITGVTGDEGLTVIKSGSMYRFVMPARNVSLNFVKAYCVSAADDPNSDITLEITPSENSTVYSSTGVPVSPGVLKSADSIITPFYVKEGDGYTITATSKTPDTLHISEISINGSEIPNNTGITASFTTPAQIMPGVGVSVRASTFRTYDLAFVSSNGVEGVKYQINDGSVQTADWSSAVHGIKTDDTIHIIPASAPETNDVKYTIKAVRYGTSPEAMNTFAEYKTADHDYEITAGTESLYVGFDLDAEYGVKLSDVDTANYDNMGSIKLTYIDENTDSHEMSLDIDQTNPNYCFGEKLKSGYRIKSIVVSMAEDSFARVTALSYSIGENTKTADAIAFDVDNNTYTVTLNEVVNAPVTITPAVTMPEIKTITIDKHESNPLINYVAYSTYTVESKEIYSSGIVEGDKLKFPADKVSKVVLAINPGNGNFVSSVMISDNMVPVAVPAVYYPSGAIVTVPGYLLDLEDCTVDVRLGRFYTIRRDESGSGVSSLYWSNANSSIYASTVDSSVCVPLGATVTLDGTQTVAPTYKGGDKGYVTISKSETPGYSFTIENWGSSVVELYTKPYTLTNGLTDTQKADIDLTRLFATDATTLTATAHTQFSSVEVKAKEDKSVRINSVSLYDTNNDSLISNISKSGGYYTFDMPEKDATIKVDYTSAYKLLLDSEAEGVRDDDALATDLNKAVEIKQVDSTGKVLKELSSSDLLANGEMFSVTAKDGYEILGMSVVDSGSSPLETMSGDPVKYVVPTTNVTIKLNVVPVYSIAFEDSKNDKFPRVESYKVSVTRGTNSTGDAGYDGINNATSMNGIKLRQGDTVSISLTGKFGSIVNGKPTIITQIWVKDYPRGGTISYKSLGTGETDVRVGTPGILGLVDGSGVTPTVWEYTVGKGDITVIASDNSRDGGVAGEKLSRDGYESSGTDKVTAEVIKNNVVVAKNVANYTGSILVPGSATIKIAADGVQPVAKTVDNSGSAYELIANKTTDSTAYTYTMPATYNNVIIHTLPYSLSVDSSWKDGDALVLPKSVYDKYSGGSSITNSLEPGWDFAAGTRVLFSVIPQGSISYKDMVVKYCYNDGEDREVPLSKEGDYYVLDVVPHNGTIEVSYTTTNLVSFEAGSATHQVALANLDNAVTVSTAPSASGEYTVSSGCINGGGLYVSSADYIKVTAKEGYRIKSVASDQGTLNEITEGVEWRINGISTATTVTLDVVPIYSVAIDQSCDANIASFQYVKYDSDIPAADSITNDLSSGIQFEIGEKIAVLPVLNPESEWNDSEKTGKLVTSVTATKNVTEFSFLKATYSAGSATPYSPTIYAFTMPAGNVTLSAQTSDLVTVTREFGDGGKDRDNIIASHSSIIDILGDHAATIIVPSGSTIKFDPSSQGADAVPMYNTGDSFAAAVKNESVYKFTVSGNTNLYTRPYVVNALTAASSTSGYVYTPKVDTDNLAGKYYTKGSTIDFTMAPLQADDQTAEISNVYYYYGSSYANSTEGNKGSVLKKTDVVNGYSFFVDPAASITNGINLYVDDNATYSVTLEYSAESTGNVLDGAALYKYTDAVGEALETRLKANDKFAVSANQGYKIYKVSATNAAPDDSSATSEDEPNQSFVYTVSNNGNVTATIKSYKTSVINISNTSDSDVSVGATPYTVTYTHTDPAVQSRLGSESTDTTVEATDLPLAAAVENGTKITISTDNEISTDPERFRIRSVKVNGRYADPTSQGSGVYSVNVDAATSDSYDIEVDVYKLYDVTVNDVGGDGSGYVATYSTATSEVQDDSQLSGVATNNTAVGLSKLEEVTISPNGISLIRNMIVSPKSNATIVPPTEGNYVWVINDFKGNASIFVVTDNYYTATYTRDTDKYSVNLGSIEVNPGTETDPTKLKEDDVIVISPKLGYKVTGVTLDENTTNATLVQGASPDDKGNWKIRVGTSNVDITKIEAVPLYDLSGIVGLTGADSYESPKDFEARPDIKLTLGESLYGLKTDDTHYGYAAGDRITVEVTGKTAGVELDEILSKLKVTGTSSVDSSITKDGVSGKYYFTFTLPKASESATPYTYSIDAVYKSYDINIDSEYGITIPDTAVNSDNKYVAAKGTEVILSCIPYTGYEFSSLMVTKGNGNQAIDSTGGKFIMPAEAVTVTAVYTKKSYDLKINDGGHSKVSLYEYNESNSTYSTVPLAPKTGTNDTYSIEYTKKVGVSIEPNEDYLFANSDAVRFTYDAGAGSLSWQTDGSGDWRKDDSASTDKLRKYDLTMGVPVDTEAGIPTITVNTVAILYKAPDLDETEYASVLDRAALTVDEGVPAGEEATLSINGVPGYELKNLKIYGNNDTNTPKKQVNMSGEFGLNADTSVYSGKFTFNMPSGGFTYGLTAEPIVYDLKVKGIDKADVTVSSRDSETDPYVVKIASSTTGDTATYKVAFGSQISVNALPKTDHVMAVAPVPVSFDNGWTWDSYDTVTGVYTFIMKVPNGTEVPTIVVNTTAIEYMAPELNDISNGDKLTSGVLVKENGEPLGSGRGVAAGETAILKITGKPGYVLKELKIYGNNDTSVPKKEITRFGEFSLDNEKSECSGSFSFTMPSGGFTYKLDYAPITYDLKIAGEADDEDNDVEHSLVTVYSRATEDAAYKKIDPAVSSTEYKTYKVAFGSQISVNVAPKNDYLLGGTPAEFNYDWSWGEEDPASYTFVVGVPGETGVPTITVNTVPQLYGAPTVDEAGYTGMLDAGNTGLAGADGVEVGKQAVLKITGLKGYVLKDLRIYPYGVTEEQMIPANEVRKYGEFSTVENSDVYTGTFNFIMPSGGFTYKLTAVPIKYPVTISGDDLIFSSGENKYFDGDVFEVGCGDTVSFTIEPEVASDYALSGDVKAYYGDDTTGVILSCVENRYSFTMPSDGVRIEANAVKNALTIDTETGYDGVKSFAITGSAGVGEEVKLSVTCEKGMVIDRALITDDTGAVTKLELSEYPDSDEDPNPADVDGVLTYYFSFPMPTGGGKLAITTQNNAHGVTLKPAYGEATITDLKQKSWVDDAEWSMIDVTNDCKAIYGYTVSFNVAAESEYTFFDNDRIKSQIYVTTTENTTPLDIVTIVPVEGMPLGKAYTVSFEMPGYPVVIWADPGNINYTVSVNCIDGEAAVTSISDTGSVEVFSNHAGDTNFIVFTFERGYEYENIVVMNGEEERHGVIEITDITDETDDAPGTVTAQFTMPAGGADGIWLRAKKKTYDILTDDMDNLTVAVKNSAVFDDEVRFTLTADKDYMLDEISVSVNGTVSHEPVVLTRISGTDDGVLYSFRMPNEDVIITASAIRKAYDIKIDPEAYEHLWLMYLNEEPAVSGNAVASVSVDDLRAYADDSVYVAFAVEPGYKVTGVKAGDTRLVESRDLVHVGEYRYDRNGSTEYYYLATAFTMTSGDIDFDVTLEAETSAITVSTDNTVITAPNEAKTGDKVSFSTEAISDYSLRDGSVSVCYTDYPDYEITTDYDNGIYSFIMPGAPVTITSGADPIPREITVYADGEHAVNSLISDNVNAAIDPVTVTKDAADNTVSFNITCREGWEIDNILVDGQDYRKFGVLEETGEYTSVYDFTLPAGGAERIDVTTRRRVYNAYEHTELCRIVPQGTERKSIFEFDTVISSNVIPDRWCRFVSENSVWIAKYDDAGVNVSDECGLNRSMNPDGSMSITFRQPAYKVVVFAVAEFEKYDIVIDHRDEKISSVNVSVEEVSANSAIEGARVQVDLGFSDGYEYRELSVTDKDGNAVEILAVETGSTYVFYMPGGGAHISAYAKAMFYDVAMGYIDKATVAIESNNVPGGKAATDSVVAFGVIPDDYAQIDPDDIKVTSGTESIAVTKTPMADGSYECSFRMPAGSVEISAKATYIKYPVTAGGDGLVHSDIDITPESAGLGDLVSFNVKAKTGYDVVSRMVVRTADGAEVPVRGNGLEGEFTFDMPGGGARIVIETRPENYLIMPFYDEEFVSYYIDAPVSGDVDSTIDFTVHVRPGYSISADSVFVYENPGNQTIFDAVSENRLPIEVVDESEHLYRFRMPASDVAIFAETNFIPYDITARGDDHVSVSVPATGLEQGTVAGFALEFTEGYGLDTLKVEGAEGEIEVKESSEDSYSFTMPVSDVSINAVSKPLDYGISVDCENAAVTGISESGTFEKTVGFKAEAEADYRLIAGSVRILNDKGEDISTKTGLKSSGSSYSFKMPACDVTIEVRPEDIIYKAAVSENATVKVTPQPAEAPAGTVIKLLAECEDGYQLKSITVRHMADDTIEEIDITSREMSFNMPSGGAYISAQTEPAIHDTGSREGNAKVEGLKGDASVGNKVEFTVTPGEGYKLVEGSVRIEDVSGNDISQQVELIGDTGTVYGTGSFSFIMPNTGIKVIVDAVKKIAYKVSYSYDSTQINVTGSPESAVENDRVDLVWECVTGYELESISVADSEGGNIALKMGAFVMPESDVTVTIKAKRAEDGTKTEEEVKEETVSKNYASVAEHMEVGNYSGELSDVYQSEEDTAATTLHFKKGRVTGVSISENDTGDSVVTVNAGVKIVGLTGGYTVVSSYNGTEYKGSNDHKLPKINTKKGTLKVKKLKNVPVYTLSIASPKGFIYLRVVDVKFDARIKATPVMPGSGDAAEAMRVDLTDSGLKSAGFISGVWKVGKTKITKIGERTELAVKNSIVYATVSANGSILIEQKSGADNTSIPVKYTLNNKQYKTSVKITSKQSNTMIANREQFIKGFDANKNRLIVPKK